MENYCRSLFPSKPTVFACLISLGLSGCGYTLNHRLQSEFQTEKGFFIPVFNNDSREVGAETVFTNALVRELRSHGEKVVIEKQSARLELVGTVNEINYVVENQSAPGTRRLQPYQRLPDQIGVKVKVFLALNDLQTGKSVWGKSFEGYRRVSASLERASDADAPSALGPLTESVIEASYRDIARDMMRDFYDNLVEIF